VRLLGWSFGALTAFASGRILAAEGWTIDELLLVDPAPLGLSLGNLDVAELALSFVADVAESIGKTDRLRELVAEPGGIARDSAEVFRVAQGLGIFPALTSWADFQNRLSVYTASARALRDFSPTSPRDSYSGRAFILAASEGNAPRASEWLPLVPESRLSVQSATHYTILEHLRNYLG
jgi:thioesterase domain-containing protein